MTDGSEVTLVRRGSDVPGSPLVSICVLVLSDPTLVLGCLGSLAAVTRSGETETIVVANGMSEGARRVLEERNDIVLVRSGTNLGFAGGNNLASEVARGRYLFFVNDDSTVTPDCMAQLLATADRDRTIGAVGSRILSADGSLQEAGSVLWSDGWAEHVGLGLPADTRRYSHVRDVDYVSANGLMVTRSAWNTVGGFDERYFPAYYEDVDLCMALRKHGYRVVYEPRARLYHLESQSTTSRYHNFLMTRNRKRLVDKWQLDLATLGDKPERIDALAIERSIHRARGSPPRLLMAMEGEAEDTRLFLWDVAETLAAVGWAITVTSPAADSDPDFRPDRSSRADRMADLGVDVRDDLDEVLATAGTDWDAVVIAAASRWRRLPITKTDGTEVPIVRLSPEEGDAGVQSAISSIAVAVDRAPAPGSPTR
ncbi:MAG TPA: glycosyltransferase family 2 protein [Acidimicrobiales bacterium]|nr:glycosyltransferase family 2 protein [Acidimicrobiales bacterium]